MEITIFWVTSQCTFFMRLNSVECSNRWSILASSWFMPANVVLLYLATPKSKFINNTCHKLIKSNLNFEEMIFEVLRLTYVNTLTSMMSMMLLLFRENAVKMGSLYEQLQTRKGLFPSPWIPISIFLLHGS